MWLRTCGRFFTNILTSIPVFLLCLLISWSYYVVVLIIGTGRIPNISCSLVFLLSYHAIAILFLWTFWQSILARAEPIPKEFHLTALETVTFIDMDSDDGRVDYLERLVVQKSLPLTMHNKRGTVPFCDICFLIKPDRTHHCSTCEKCIPKMDHHCPWINNCVGFHNQKYFVLFLFYAICYCLLCSLASFPFVRLLIQGQLDLSTGGMHAFFLFIIALVFALAVGILFGFQTMLVMKNKLTLEFHRPPIFRDASRMDSFDLGLKQNMEQVFGTEWRLWCFPLFSSLGTGFTFPMRSSLQHSDREPLLA
ncbi:hypothetical protein CRM22_004476 [Opisthorchis felineus]|uniref:Palmitoyltransferase n=1 Tax=Opisthorchis felineus TaxID=147828 RepID=A0A4S2LVZ6_OPIFE|nr:hypothetical protein CRM22_004476 [Opisthorchis felineus]